MNFHIKVSNADHKQGSNSASFVLVEYGDYECIHCGAAYPVIKKLQRHFGDNLLFVFRNFPLTDIHPYAAEAACAAEAAGMQGKFWPMHDLIFENQQILSSTQLLNFGRVIGADMQVFIRDMHSETVRNKIMQDLEGGVRGGVSGTPTFFFNDERYLGFNDFESMKEAIGSLLTQ